MLFALGCAAVFEKTAIAIVIIAIALMVLGAEKFKQRQQVL
jgi:hypothetical protein